MISNKKGISFVAVVGSCVFMILLATIAITTAANNNLLVNSFSSTKKTYSLASDSLRQSAELLITNSKGKSMTRTNLLDLCNERLDLDTNFSIDELKIEDIVDANVKKTSGGILSGKQISLRKSNYYINVFLSDDGTQTSLSNIFFDKNTSLSLLYSSSFLTTSYLYENGLFFDTDNLSGPIRNTINDTNQNKSLKAEITNNSIYNLLLPANPQDDYTKFNEDQTEYKESYIRGQLMDAAISKTFLARKCTEKWDCKTTTFQKNSTTFINGDIELRNSTLNKHELILEDNAVLYINGNLTMNSSSLVNNKSYSGHLPTKLILGKNALLVVNGTITIENDAMNPIIKCHEKSNVIASNYIKIVAKQNSSKVTGEHSLYSLWNKAGFLGKLLCELAFTEEYFETIQNDLMGGLEGTFITGDKFIIEMSKGNNETMNPLPTRATIYSDNDINMNNACVRYTGPSFFFSKYVRFCGNSTTLDFAQDFFSSYQVDNEYLFVIVDDSVEYKGMTNSLCANIFTTNTNNNQNEIVKKINDVYQTGSTGSYVIDSIFNWLDIDTKVNYIKKEDINIDVSNFGLPNILTEGDSDLSYASNIKQ